MTYFINIVECGCNLSIAAKKIHISQSALSQFVTNFESTEGVQLFNRRNGRLESLTEAGGKIYRFATEIVNRHEEMQSMIQYIIQVDEYVAYMDKNHPLANKELLKWKDIAQYGLATFNKSFTTYDLITEKLKSKKIKANFAYLSSTWDFLIESTYQNDMIALLPRPLEYFVDKNKFRVVRFKDPVPFNIWFCRPYKANYNEVEAYVYEELLKGYYQPLSEPHP